MTAFSRVAVVQNSIGSVFRLNSAPSGPSGPARFHTASPRRSHCQRPATENTPTHKASGWIGLLKLPSMRIGRSFISSKTAQGATPEPLQRVPPRCRGTTCRTRSHPGRLSFDTAPGFRLMDHARMRSSVQPIRSAPRSAAALALHASCHHSAHRVSPASLHCRACQAPKVQRFPSNAFPTRHVSPSRSRSNRRLRSPAIPRIAVSAQRDSKARDLPGPILHRATD